MRSKIYLYLFLFALLLIIFQYMNEKKIFENQETKIENLQKRLQKSNDSIDGLNNRVADLNYFTLQGNDNAMTYLENLGFDANAVENLITDEIYEQNTIKGDHPLVPHEGIEGDLKINKLRFLNHKWILADFTDGVYWGEMILEYAINEKKEVVLHSIASFIYPR